MKIERMKEMTVKKYAFAMAETLHVFGTFQTVVDDKSAHCNYTRDMRSVHAKEIGRHRRQEYNYPRVAVDLHQWEWLAMM